MAATRTFEEDSWFGGVEDGGGGIRFRRADGGAWHAGDAAAEVGRNSVSGGGGDVGPGLEGGLVVMCEGGEW